MNYLLLILFGFAPSLIWLLYFLRKDVHPENNSQVVKIFVYGFLTVFPAALIQLGFFDLVSPLKPSLGKTILLLFLNVALVEEGVKYLVVRDKVLNSPHFDEPTDLPLYMIISALGFAAAENLLAIVGPNLMTLSATRTITVSLFRLVSATFLHALASGTLGIFLAAAIYRPGFKKRLLTAGFLLAVFLHGLYNFSIMVIEGNVRFLLPFLVLTNLAVVLSLGFSYLKKLKSVCQLRINN